MRDVTTQSWAARQWLGWTSPASLSGQASTPASVPVVMRARFAAAEGDFHVAERFDDHAARLYFDADDPDVTGDQEQSIRRLLQRRKEMIGTPLVTSLDEQDPRFGPWTISLLTLGEYADHMYANNTYIHLNNPPITIPPRVLDVHFCWGVRTAGAVDASVLHGVAALIIDDWQSALRDVAVRFHLHRFGPIATTLAVGRGGRRWRDREALRLPPERVVGLLFARANRAHAMRPFEPVGGTGGRSGTRVKVGDDGGAVPPTRQWWCACLLEADLPALGFERGAGRASDTAAVWTAARSGLPDAVEHVILVPPAEGAGAFYRVDVRAGATTLEPLRQGRHDREITWWHGLRVQALDMALDELLARMA